MVQPNDIRYLMDDKSKKDGIWNIGEQLVYVDPSLKNVDIINSFSIDFQIIDYEFNKIIVMGSIPIK